MFIIVYDNNTGYRTFAAAPTSRSLMTKDIVPVDVLVAPREAFEYL
ncbi:MAG: hypothetical protein O7A03_11075 [Alphaproteobacteria bacterium]|nr:hypothetical protein [Alphaproteobacteria bacterium]